MNSECQFRRHEGEANFNLTHLPEKPGSQSKIKRISRIFKRVISHSLLLSLSKCKGFTSISEDSSEISFLLVENYNYDHSLWSSDRMGIFGQYIAPSF